MPTSLLLLLPLLLKDPLIVYMLTVIPVIAHIINYFERMKLSNKINEELAKNDWTGPMTKQRKI